jgi:hypothetical protein
MIYQEEIAGITEVCEISAEAFIALTSSLACITIDPKGNPAEVNLVIEKSGIGDSEQRIQ